ncbi:MULTISPECIES: MFS transporter [unclassified Beijerinckia]|uniref:MFS transporter n=1 Tax=unclassified Beijerinckia TaxID=2638183 RepID=UPI0008997157|nr:MULTISPECIES: MFS transporter [unclassified Beijerinckia]MDH7799061.1 AAHS family 4-hydroxybenzoate transporter-like MFS transporter [Beijerinckia sp. GAS462]SED96346.1 MFS transporter, AAHS family, 4-hydroxybenzoate transporter [Beijerinckia sp. 28-YEA-48]
MSAIQSVQPFEVEDAVETGRMTALQWRVVALCGLVALFDGFDTQSIGPSASAIAADLGIPVSSFGTIFSMSQVSFLIGALAFGPIGDRYGRRPVLIAMTLLFGVASLLTAFSNSYWLLLVSRFLGGLGLGGASPTFVSLAASYVPRALRARVITGMWAAVPFGGMLGSFVAALLIPETGWRPVFLIGGVLPLLVCVLLVVALPESLDTLVARGRGTAGQVAAIVAKLRPDLADLGSRQFVRSGQLPVGAPIRDLFTQGRAASTLALWLASFLGWLIIVVVAFWTPPLMQKAGMSTEAAASILGIENIGGVIGTCFIGFAIDRLGAFRALFWSFCFAATMLLGLGICAPAFGASAVFAAVLGFFASGSAAGLIALSATLYPSHMRGTGVGWALGIGRIGSILGPLAVGHFLFPYWSVATIYAVLFVPALAAACTVIFLGLLHRNLNADMNRKENS